MDILFIILAGSARNFAPGNKLRIMDNRQKKRADRVPPKAPELEQAVLAAMMMDELTLDKVIGEVNADTFYEPRHRLIFEAVARLHSRNLAVDILTVTNQMKSDSTLDDAGGYSYVAELMTSAATVAHVDYHVAILKQKAIQRGLIAAAFEIQSKAYDEAVDVDELMSDAQNRVYSIIQQNMRKEAVNVKDALNDVIEDISERQSGNGPRGVATGYDSIDRISMGWQPGNLIVIGARPGIGKTAIALNLAANAAIIGKVPVAFFSLEMTQKEIITRLLEAQTGITGDKVKGRVKMSADDWRQLEQGILGLSRCDFYIDDTPAIPITEFKAKASYLVNTKKIGIIFVDYLQIMKSPKSQNLREEVSDISHMLKATAKDLNVPIIALAQLNRQVTQRGSLGRPILSDIKESGAIEQDADIVMFLHRPDQLGMENPEDRNSAEIIVAKNRNGAVCTIPMSFQDSIVKFIEPANTLSFIAQERAAKAADNANRVYPAPQDDFYNPFNEF